jgi:hypothetical protein
MLTRHHVYYYSLSRGLMLVSFPPIKHVLFYSWTTFKCWIREELEADVAVFHSDIDLVMLED